MKLMKKLLTILFAFMMVLATTSMVSAAETTGKITINGVKGQTYKIYKIFDLESYDATNEHYSYKVVDAWNSFFTTGGDGASYIEVDENGYVVKWKEADTGEKKAEFAKKALAYANTTTSGVSATQEKTQDATSTSVEFAGLELGYYLVDSSVGTLCYLDTTKTEVTINEKNNAPSIEKKIKLSDTSYADTNTANIGDTIEFKTTITAQLGAQNYKLIDTMDAGLKFDSTSVKVSKNGTVVTNTTTDKYYELKTTGLSVTGATFEIDFTETFCNNLKKDDKIEVTYSAELLETAKTGATGNTNKTKLTYGDNNKNSTDEKTTTTKTFEVPVFKYEEPTTGTMNALAGAKFKLSKNQNPSSTDYYSLVSVTGETRTYRIAKTGEADVGPITTETSTETLTGGGNYNFKFKGLAAGEYWLIETEAPSGYNKCKPVKITITEDGNITVNSDATTQTVVGIENKTSKLLPSTGGVGTTMMYIVGAVLLIGSGVVLITKKNVK